MGICEAFARKKSFLTKVRISLCILSHSNSFALSLARQAPLSLHGRQARGGVGGGRDWGEEEGAASEGGEGERERQHGLAGGVGLCPGRGSCVMGGVLVCLLLQAQGAAVVVV